MSRRQAGPGPQVPPPPCPPPVSVAGAEGLRGAPHPPVGHPSTGATAGRCRGRWWSGGHRAVWQSRSGTRGESRSGRGAAGPARCAVVPTVVGGGCSDCAQAGHITSCSTCRLVSESLCEQCGHWIKGILHLRVVLCPWMNHVNWGRSGHEQADEVRTTSV